MPGPPPKKTQKFDRSIVEGPLGPAVWRLAWPTMLQNVIAGLQGIIDHAMVGHFVGYRANAAIGVSWQIILVVIVFISSLFTGMAVLVARFAGANEPDKVNRVVYQAFLTAIGFSVLMGVVGYVASPFLLDLVNAAPEVKAEALPFLRTMFLGIFGMMMFFMLSGAFRAAGDPRTPLRLGVTMTVLTVAFNVILIPAFGTVGAALRHHRQQHARVRLRRLADVLDRVGDPLPARHGPGARLHDHPVAVPLRASDRRAGDRDEHRRRHAARVHRLARAQRRRAGGLRRRLHGALLADQLDVGRADGRGRDHLGTEPRRGESRARDAAASRSHPGSAWPWPPASA